MNRTLTSDRPGMLARRLGIFSMIAVAVTCLFFSTGCNTMEGVGQDVQAAGDSIEDAAN